MQPASGKIAIVDCGSGSSRMSIYSYHADDGYVHEDKYVPSNILPTLVPSIANGASQAWVDKLEDVVADEGPDIQIIVGSTGGLRKALALGQLTEAQVEGFETLLVTKFSGRARMLRLSGEAEAEMELAAVRYIAKHALLPVRPRFGGGTQRIGSEIGILSCGGASSQIAYHPHLQGTDKDCKGSSATQFTSLNTNLLDAMKAARDYGHQSWQGKAFAYTEDLMWKRIAEIGGPLGKLRGTFVVIELAGSIGKEAGLADRLVPKREAIQLLTQHLESMQRLAGKDLKTRLAEEKEGASKHTPQSVSFFQEARVPLTIIALALLDLFSSQAWFFFATSFQVGSEDNVLRAQWPLGVFLQERGMNQDSSTESSSQIQSAALESAPMAYSKL